jgi:hypothetical protein
MNRRAFLASSATAALGALIPKCVWADPAAGKLVEVVLKDGPPLGMIAPDFVGLGYEISSIAEAGLLSPKNARMIQLYSNLAPAGVIRIGGNTSDDARYSPNGALVSKPVGTVVNARSLAELGDFLRATNWKLIWGLNLGIGTEQEAADEAAAIVETAKDHLLALEIGNEPDLFAPVHRKRGWNYDLFHTDYIRFKKVIRARLPGVPLAGPDVAGNTDWVERFAKDEAGDAVLLTHHHYSQGPPENPKTTIENLLAGKTPLQKILLRLQSISANAKIPYRFCEVNSCFHGGKPGVADTFASALWVLDLMHTMASFDCAGINIETGINQLNRISDYSPIYPDGKGGYIARPIYYGMLAFARGGRGKRMQIDLDTADANFKAFATKADGVTRLTLINKELEQPIEVKLRAPPGVSATNIVRLVASSASSKDGVSFAGAKVDADGRWQPADGEKLELKSGECLIAMPACSAAVVEFQVRQTG